MSKMETINSHQNFFLSAVQHQQLYLCHSLRRKKKWGGGTSGFHSACYKVVKKKSPEIGLFSTLIPIRQTAPLLLSNSESRFMTFPHTPHRFSIVWGCVGVRVRSLLCVCLPEAPQPRRAVVPSEQQDNQTDCWIRKDKRQSVIFFSIFPLLGLWVMRLARISSRFFFLGIIAELCFCGTTQTGMDLVTTD